MSENDAHVVLTDVDGGVTAPSGFSAGAVACGIKRSGKLDLALLAADHACPAAGVYTRNTMAAPPVTLTRRNLAAGPVRAIVANSGNANACTGPVGVTDALAMAEAVAVALGCAPTQVAVASTGVIGVPLPMALVLPGIEAAADVLSDAGGPRAAEAVMTTDTFIKQAAVALTCDGVRYTVGGMAKGSGMIMPDMATMLAFLTTDAPLSAEACDALLRPAADATFNRITVDSDTSTNDMCLLMASGAAGGAPIAAGDARLAPLAAAVREVCARLAEMIVRDGEGASKLVRVTVCGARSDADAEMAARTVANSPLFKTAIFGADANWGRVAAALGKSGAALDPGRVEIVFAGITTCREGAAVPFDEARAAEALSADEVDVLADLHLGEGSATVLTCDLTYDYVRINGEYRS